MFKHVSGHRSDLIGLLGLALAFGSEPYGLSAQVETGREIPTVEARFTRLFSSDSMFIGSPVVSPDGRWLAFDCFEEGQGHIWVVSTGGGEPIRLTSGNNMNQIPQWFPSGDRIAFLSNQPAEGQTGLLYYVMSIPFDPETGRATGPARQVSLEPAREPMVSPDGRWIAYGRYLGRGGIRLIPSNGGNALTLATRGRNPAWSEDSQYVYFASRNRDPLKYRLERVGTDGGEASLVAEFDSEFHAIGPDGRYLLRATEEEGEATPWLDVLSRQGDILGRIPLHRDMDAGYQGGFTGDGNGALAVVRDRDAAVFVAPVAGGSARQVSEGRAYEAPLGWTPDNQAVFYKTRLNGRDAVVMAPISGGPAEEIPLPEQAADPIVPSADGRYLAYALGTEEEAPRTVMVRRISDGETHVLSDAFIRGLRFGGQVLGPGGGVTDGDAFLYLEQNGDKVNLRASPPEGLSRLVRSFALEGLTHGRSNLGVHGDWVAYPETSGDSATLYLSTGDTEPIRALATVPGFLEGIFWSWDRRWIVAGNWVSGERGYEIYLLVVGLNTDGSLASEPRVIETGVGVIHAVQWLPDNQTVALHGMKMGQGVGNNIWLIPIRDGGTPVKLSLDDTSGVWSASLSPDGRHMAYGQEIRGGSSIWLIDYGEFLRERGMGGR
ncbi:MAG: hypothetical protein PVJ76_09170 [Gemmatimonadota bacterium]